MAALLRYDDDVVMTLKDDATTANALVRRTPRERLLERRFGEWSAVEVLAHVTDVAEVMRRRIERCVADDVPSIEAIGPGTLADEPDPLRLTRRLQTAHSAIVELLLEPGAAEREAIHPEFGRVNAGFFAAYQAKHGHEHIDELARAFPPA